MSSSADFDPEKTVGGADSGDAVDNDYQSRTGQGDIPVTKDDAQVEDPIDPNTADSDEQLVRDDNEAIDKSNIVDGRTRGAKPSGGYREPGDDEGIPDDSGVSST
ncbi:MAG: hypothetical protein Q9227_003890 [Pyrenula ochraceoflavens]